MNSLWRNSTGLVLLALAAWAWAWPAPARAQADGDAVANMLVGELKEEVAERLKELTEPAGGRGGKDYSPYPNPDAGYVTDLARLLTRDREERIEQWLWATEERTGVEIIVVTIDAIDDYPKTANASIKSFAKGLFDSYRIGNRPDNNGVLLLVAVKDRQARIELGYSYGQLRDGDSGRIMQRKIAPALKKEDYARGLEDGVKAIMLEFAGVRVGPNWPLIIVLVATPVCALIAVSLFKNGKRGWGWVFAGIVLILLLAAFWLICALVRNLPRGGRGGSSGFGAMGSSSSWSAGGIGGFGGGFSGGGGATGCW